MPLNKETKPTHTHTHTHTHTWLHTCAYQLTVRLKVVFVYMNKRECKSRKRERVGEETACVENATRLIIDKKDIKDEG